MDLCTPGSEVSRYIKCVHLGTTSTPYGSGDWFAEAKAKFEANKFLNEIYESFSPRCEFRNFDFFLDPGTLEPLFLWQLLRPVVIRVDSVSELRRHLGVSVEIAKLSKLQLIAPSNTQWTRLAISVGDRSVKPKDLTHMPSDAMHFVVTTTKYNILSDSKFWRILGEICEVLACSLKHIHVEIDGINQEPEWSQWISGDFRWYETDLQLHNLYSYEDSVLQEVRISGNVEGGAIFPNLPNSKRLNLFASQEKGSVTLRATETRIDNSFDFRVSREKMIRPRPRRLHSQSGANQ